MDGRCRVPEDEASDQLILDSGAGIEGIIPVDSTPHACIGNEAANQAGSFALPPLKPALAYEQQVSLMRARGLTVPDESKALELLAETNYYRLRGYWLTLENEAGFKAGTSFDDIWDIYALDSELRLWLWSAIAPVEIKLRTSFAYHTAHALGPQGYEDSANYSNVAEHTKSMKSLARERDRALRDGVPCVKHNIEKYGVLPIWAAVEIMSMGTVSRLYGNLSGRASYEDGTTVRAAIAHDFDVKTPYLTSWLRHLTYVRNICGHHNRFYNRMMTSRPKLLKMDLAVADSAKQFPTFIVLKRLYEHSWPERWESLYESLTESVEAHGGVDLRPMGFPDDWRSLLELAQ